MAAIDPTSGLATDARSLERLKQDARRDPVAATRAAAAQFEALFMQSLLKSMRGAIQKSGLTDNAQTETYTAMLDQQLAQKLSGRPGGLSEIIARQLSRSIGSAGTAAATAADAAAGAGAAAARLVGATAHQAPQGRQLAHGTDLPGDGDAPQPGPVRAAGTGLPASGPVIRAADLIRIDPSQATPAVRAAAAAAAATAAGSAAGDLAQDPNAAAQARFVRAMWPHAVVAQRETGTAAHLVVGQAALESGWGRHEILHPDGRSSHNLFGIKAGRNWQGRTVEAMTTEFVDGKPLRLVQRFRAYESYAEAFSDWSRLMSGSERYGGVIKAGHDPGHYARQMQDAGYATDPAYAEKLEKTIRRTIALRRLVI